MKPAFTISFLYALCGFFSLGGRGVYSSIHSGSGELELLLKHLLNGETTMPQSARINSLLLSAEPLLCP